MATARDNLRRSWRWIAVAAALAALLLSLLGLRGELTSADAQGRPHRAKKKVEIEDFAYHPKTLRIRRGTRVVFVNGDGLAHTVTRTRRRGFDSGRIRPGRSFTIRFKRKGTFRYRCTIHPFMRGKVVVR